MASTVGHALCGVSCLLAVIAASPGRPIPFTFRSVALFVVLANLPDIDFLAGYLWASDPHLFHQRATHTLAFAGLAGFLAGIVWRGPFGLWTAAGAFSFTILSHDLVDMLSGPAPGFNRSPGLALLWPFDEGMVSAPLTIFAGIRHSTIEELIGLHNVMAMAHECAVFLPIIALLYVWRAKNPRIRANGAG